MPQNTVALLTEQSTAWQQILAHPFVAETSAGSLPQATFDRWLTEDAPDAGARGVLSGGLAALVPELDLFEEEAAARGLDLTAEPSLLNLGYSSYLLASVGEGWQVGITVLYGVEKAYY